MGLQHSEGGVRGDLERRIRTRGVRVEQRLRLLESLLRRDGAVLEVTQKPLLEALARTASEAESALRQARPRGRS